MPCHPIYDFVLSITTSNVIWWDKNVKSMFQEGVHAFYGKMAFDAKFNASTYKACK